MTEPGISRRTLATFVGATAVALTAPAIGQGGTMSYEIKPLPFDPKQIKGLSEKLLLSHYENNYGGAVKRLNAIAAELAQLDYDKAPGFVINGLKREELIAANSMVVHELYFAGLGAESRPGGKLAEALQRDFGGYDKWAKQFAAMGKALGGGSGWVLLTWSPRDRRLLNQWAADHTTMAAGCQPILALDLFEHAYHMDYGQGRGLCRCVPAGDPLGQRRGAVHPYRRVADRDEPGRRSDPSPGPVAALTWIKPALCCETSPAPVRAFPIKGLGRPSKAWRMAQTDIPLTPLRPRPLSPHLQVYRPQISSVLSILHRITGVGLGVGAIWLTSWLYCAAKGGRSFEVMRAFNSSAIGVFLLIAFAFALYYHLCNGIRHLCWDAGWGFEIKTMTWSGWLVVAAAGVLTVLSVLAGAIVSGVP